MFDRNSEGLPSMSIILKELCQQLKLCQYFIRVVEVQLRLNTTESRRNKKKLSDTIVMSDKSFIW